jgi:hypothetical protein
LGSGKICLEGLLTSNVSFPTVKQFNVNKMSAGMEMAGALQILRQIIIYRMPAAGTEILEVTRL